jgi:hypothetical protein
MATILGKPVSFGFSGTDGIAETTYFTGKIILQSADHEYTSDEEQVRNAAGNLATRSFYNPGDKASLEYIPTGSNLAGVTANVNAPAVGTIVNITACADMPTLIKTNWVVIPGAKVNGSNVGIKRITLPLEAHAGITVAAS